MLGTIETGLIRTISEASENGAFESRLKKVTSYKAGLDRDIPLLLKGESPAVWVTFDREEALPPANYAPTFHAFFTVLVFCRNLRRESAARLGDGGKGGAYRIISDMKRLLIDSDCGLPISPFEYVNTKRAAPSEDAAPFHTGLYEIQFATKYSLPKKESDELPPLEHVNTTWELPDFLKPSDDIFYP